MTNISERKQALEAVLNQKTNEMQKLEAARNNLITEVVRIQGKLELLNELELESSDKNKGDSAQ